ncbi:MAG: 3-isopropylmalate dehydratase small subunit [Bifidobacteriaceae bacterium]|jgi:3-isopropylmalate/(R)-2-methylmalate dehydratase small subunit|nr:3-isopropylmalate dehydratase small subunit [Bifidobacteriaceae bacterium]
MKEFTTYQGELVPIMNDNIDTDQIIPKVYLKRIEKTGFGEFLFDEWRYDDNRATNPDFPLNFPQHSNASILLTGDNFGSGSSREHAVWALIDYGFRAIIAGSYSDIFYMNATKNGLLPIVLPLEDRKILEQVQPNELVTIDLPNQIVSTADSKFHFNIDSTIKHKLVNALDDIQITLGYLAEIEAYENVHTTPVI